MRTGKILLCLVPLLLLSASFALAEDDINQQVDMYVFYGRGCLHCAKLLSFLEELKEDYSSIAVHEYEIYFDNNNRELFGDMADAFGTEILGVPTTFINGKVISGFSTEPNRFTGEEPISDILKREIERCVKQRCESPIERLESKRKTGVISIVGESSPTENPEKIKTIQKLTIPAVISAAIVDAINPCAFAVLIILLTTILSAGIKKRVLLAGLAFTASIYISYFLMGLGLYSAIQAAGLTRLFYSIVAVLAILVGLFNLKDYLWYGKWFVMEVPMSWRPKLKALIKGVTSIPGAFLIGFVVSLFLLPCTSGPYIVILGLLARATTRNNALMLLLLYNFIFILPMLLITAAVYFGFTTTEKAEEWRKKKLKVLHLIAGIIILLLGIGMFVAMGLGLV